MAEETKETKKIIPESKKKHKKKHKKKKVLLKVSVVFLLLVVIGWFTFGAKVMKLRSEAKKLVAQSSEETFKASQTSIVYDTNGKQLLKFKGEKDDIAGIPLVQSYISSGRYLISNELYRN